MKLQHYNRGFTLIEMLVVIAIFSIFTTILVLDYNKFGEREKFVNFMYDTALNVRQTQINGIAVREAGAGNFDRGYGIHFPVSDSNESSYTLFVDVPGEGTPGNKVFDADLNEGVQTITLNDQYEISEICVYEGDDDTCRDEEAYVDIVFLRPNPDAYIRLNGEDTVYSRADITFTYTRGSEEIERTLVIDTTGQISIQ